MLDIDITDLKPNAPPPPDTPPLPATGRGEGWGHGVRGPEYVRKGACKPEAAKEKSLLAMVGRRRSRIPAKPGSGTLGWTCHACLPPF